MGDGVAIERLHLLLSLAIQRLDLRYIYTTCTCATCGRNLYGACATDALEMCNRDVYGTCGTDAPYSTRQMRLILRDPLHMPHI